MSTKLSFSQSMKTSLSDALISTKTLLSREIITTSRQPCFLVSATSRFNLAHRLSTALHKSCSLPVSSLTSRFLRRQSLTCSKPCVCQTPSHFLKAPMEMSVIHVPFHYQISSLWNYPMSHYTSYPPVMYASHAAVICVHMHAPCGTFQQRF